jgi:transcriptional regulator with XRE-family HTH domain
MEVIIMTLGEKLKEARRGIAFSQEQLAEKLCVTRQAVTKWESDKGMPDIGNLKAIATLLNISIDYLLDNDSNIDKLIIKESINLDDFIKSGRCRCKQDAVVLNKFKDADFIYPLMRKKKLTPIENVLDFITQPGIFDIAYQLKDRNEYYLIEKENQQYFVSVSKEFIETRQLSSSVNPKKFAVGDIEYKKVPYELLKQ